jgi:hypothetical protein
LYKAKETHKIKPRILQHHQYFCYYNAAAADQIIGCWVVSYLLLPGTIHAGVYIEMYKFVGRLTLGSHGFSLSLQARRHKYYCNSILQKFVII